MFKEMRRKDRQLEKQEAYEILKNNSYGVLSTISSNEYPYGIPLNYVFFENSIYLHGALKGQKFENIKTNNKVSFCVVGKTEILSDKFTTNYESVVIFGEAYDVSKEERESVFMEFFKKYSKDYIEEGKEYIKKVEDKTKLIKINIEKITGKARR